MVIWNGMFSPVVTKNATPKIRTLTERELENPRVVDTPPQPIPDTEDLEVWGGAGYAIDSWLYANVHYVSVVFNHRDVCFVGEDVPSNDKTYVYVFDENDLEDLVFSDLGIPLDEI